MPLGERDPEAKVADLRPTAIVLVIPSLLLIGAAGALGFLYFRLPEDWQRWTAVGGAAFLILIGFVLPLIVWLSRRYTVTTRRTIIRDGLLSRSRREILHSKVLEVRLERHAGQLAVGTGHVILVLGQTGSGGPNGDNGAPAPNGQMSQAMLRGIRSPKLVQAALTDLIDAQRDERERRQTDDPGLSR